MSAYLQAINNAASAPNLTPRNYGPPVPLYHDNFPLIDLPPELRCMVYEQVDYETKCHTLNRDEVDLRKTSWPPNPSGASSSIELIRHCLPVALLRTSRLISAEATPILRKKFAEFEKKPLRFQVDYSALIALTAPSGPLAGSFSAGTAQHPIKPASGDRALQFQNRCGPFMARKPSQDDSAADAPVSVCIIIMQHHEKAPRHLTTAAFEGARKLRNISQKFMCEVLYYLPYGFISAPGGTLPTWPTVRIKGLLKPAYDWELRKVQAMKEKAWPVEEQRPENRHRHCVVSPRVWTEEMLEELKEKKEMMQFLDLLGL